MLFEHLVYKLDLSRLCLTLSRSSNTCCVQNSDTRLSAQLSGHAPGYPADDCQLVTDARARLYCVPPTRGRWLSTVHPAALGTGLLQLLTTRVWNSLPPDLRKAKLSYFRFRRSLKICLFAQPDHGALWTLLPAPCRNIPTYLINYLHLKITIHFIYRYKST